MDETAPELDLPGFRFHPTEEELLDFYLRNVIFGKRLRFDIIGHLNIYRHHPWELPGLAKIGEREWYFFVPRDRKHGSGGRPNRTTEHGYWKATGSDRKIFSLSDPKRIIGLRKTLVFYKGRAPRGSKTDWVMNEYRLPDSCPIPKDMVLCKIYRKATSFKVLEQMAATEEEMKAIHASSSSSSSSPLSSMNAISFLCQQEDTVAPMPLHHVVFKTEAEEGAMAKDYTLNRVEKRKESEGSTLQLAIGKEKLPELQVPALTVDNWNQDPLWSNSSWLQNLTPIDSYHDKFFIL